MDTAVILAIIGLAGTVITVTVGGFVAVFTNKSEKTQTAESTMEGVLRERIVLKDEMLEERDAELVEKDRIIEGLHEDVRQLTEANSAQHLLIMEMKAGKNGN